jgi:hypothetical protein
MTIPNEKQKLRQHQALMNDVINVFKKHGTHMTTAEIVGAIFMQLQYIIEAQLIAGTDLAGKVQQKLQTDAIAQRIAGDKRQ